jgi:hypothetical protein
MALIQNLIGAPAKQIDKMLDVILNESEGFL